MADKPCRETRRHSFHRIVTDHTLPVEYLERLELKRRQLDDSIHKYVAAKEREFKQYEKELRHLSKVTGLDTSDGSLRPRASSDSSRHTLAQSDGDLALSGQSSPVAVQSESRDAKLHIREDGSGDESVSGGSAILSSPQLQRLDAGREKDLAGIFTPHYLGALSPPPVPALDRTISEPPTTSRADRLSDAGLKRMQRANSDTAVQASPRRPAHLSLASRTSSSGSEVDASNRLTSVLKSPTHAPRPTRKRVSLAVGDAIVAPTDSVPDSMASTTIPSHSRARAVFQDKGTDFVDESEVVSGPVCDVEVTQPRSILSNSLASSSIDTHVNGASNPMTFEKVAVNGNVVSTIAQSSLTESKASRIDPDGDLFDLEQEEIENTGNFITEDLDDGDELIGRVATETATKDEQYYEPSEGIMPVPQSIIEAAASDTVEVRPGSVNAAQQPTHAGFRRPSVVSDPIYRGPDYDRAEYFAVTADVYGSSSRPSSRGSFAPGSVGEEFMERNMRRHTPVGSLSRTPR